MKKRLIIVFLVFFAIAQGCKKGDGDALISLKSRAARMVGVWEIESWSNVTDIHSTTNQESRYASGGITSMYNSSIKRFSSTSENITGNTVSYSIKYNSSQTQLQSQIYAFYIEDSYKNGGGNVKVIIEFEKDGTFTRTIEYSNLSFVNNKTESGSGNTDTIAIVSTESLKTELSGSWEFLGGVSDEFKNKERVVLHVLNSSSNLKYADNFGEYNSEVENVTYKDGEFDEIWKLETLRKNEIVFEAESSYTQSLNNTHKEEQNSVLTENNYTSSYTKNSKIIGTLKQ